jgi:hypothetical protein
LNKTDKGGREERLEEGNLRLEEGNLLFTRGRDDLRVVRYRCVRV